MLNRLILKATKFQLPPPKRLGTVVKNILGRHHAPLPPSQIGLRLLTDVRFFRQNGLIRLEDFWYMERGKNLEKNHVIAAQKITFLRVFNRKNTLFEIVRNLI